MTRKKTKRRNIYPDDPVTAYARLVTSKQQLAGPLVRAACKRHLDDLVKGPARGLQWDIAAAQRVIGFFSDVLRLNGGEHEGGQFVLEPAQIFIVGSLFGWKTADGYRRFRVAFIEKGKGNGKALAIETPIATPHGWATMGDLRNGDTVFDETGKPCRVVVAHPVSDDSVCYRVEFDDGESIIASAEHLWKTEKRAATKIGEDRATKGIPKLNWGAWRNGLRTTSAIAETIRYANGNYQSANHSVALAGALQLPIADLPIDPYLLGVWLGDGDSDCARITIGQQDQTESVAALVAVGSQVARQAVGTRYRIAGLQTKLRAAGLLNNKHIPRIYLRASLSQRFALLQGLMDTDGYISPVGQCEFTQVNRELSEQVLELALSLGLKATISEGVATLNGRAIGPKYRIMFDPTEDQPCFRLPRKLERQRTRHNRRRLSADRKIIACEKVAPVPVRCITVDSPSGMFLAGRSMVPTHNSPLAAGIGLYMLTADGEPRAEVYAAATKKDQAMVLFRDAVAMVDQSPVLRDAVRKIGGVSPWNLVYQRTSSFFRSIASDDAQSGPRPHCALLDEIHEHPDDMIVEMMRAGTKGRRQALIFMITNSGTDKTSVCWRYHEYTDRIVNGIVEDDSFFGFVCSLDPNDDWKDESIWLKANPLLNVSITLKYLREQVREAIGMPGKQSKVRRLNFCEWVEASNPWIDQDLWNSCEQEIDLTSLHGLPCFGGLDLSGKNDLSSLTLTFRIGSNLVSVSWFWTPKDTMRQREDRDRVPYTLWSEQGHLEATPGKSIDYAFIAKKIGDLAAVFNIKEIAFDRYRIDDLFRELDEAGIEAYVVTGDEDGSGIRMIPHGQGFVDMGRAVDALETSVLNGNIRVQKNPVMTMCAANAVLVEDPAGNRKFDKRKGKSSGRIDGVLSLAMSVRRAGMPVEPERKYQLMFV